jgi:hypothetical protein
MERFPFTKVITPSLSRWGAALTITSPVTLRCGGQADYLLTRFTYSDNQLHFNNNNARISAGLVVRF